MIRKRASFLLLVLLMLSCLAPENFDGPTGAVPIELNAREDAAVPVSAAPIAHTEQQGKVNVSKPDQSLHVSVNKNGWTTQVLSIAVVLALFIPSPAKKLWSALKQLAGAPLTI